MSNMVSGFIALWLIFNQIVSKISSVFIIKVSEKTVFVKRNSNMQN